MIESSLYNDVFKVWQRYTILDKRQVSLLQKSKLDSHSKNNLIPRKKTKRNSINGILLKGSYWRRNIKIGQSWFL